MLYKEIPLGNEHLITLVQKDKGETSTMVHSKIVGALKQTEEDHTYHQVVEGGRRTTDIVKTEIRPVESLELAHHKIEKWKELAKSMR